MSRLLIVDDEPSICWGLEQLGRSMGLEVSVASSAEQGLATAESSRPDAILLDVRLPGIDGLTALPQFRAVCGDVPIIVMTAHGSLETALHATRTDAFEYLLKPFDLDTVADSITRALAARTAPTTPLPEPAGNPAMAGRSRAMQEVFRRIALASQSEVPVLIGGESGTGKELVAREIHRHGLRQRGPFVAVNVAALNPSLAESELFGHARGSFTGATAAREGLLMAASGGTLFLDEVADIPLPIQVKLLRALELGEVVPVGTSQPLSTRFRIIAATHCDLEQLVAAGSFRHDLYFRIAGFRIDLPPLRDRPEDILDLAAHYLRQVTRSGIAVPAGLAPATIGELQRRNWPGNVRELFSALGHACLMARGGRIEPQHLPAPGIRESARQVPGQEGTVAARIAQLVTQWASEQLAMDPEAADLHARLLELVESPLFQAVIAAHAGQVAPAARQLGLHRTTLKRRLDEAGEGSVSGSADSG